MVDKPPRKQMLVPGKMILGSKTEADVEKSKIIEKQKKEKKKQDRAKAEDNSWIHTSASSVNSYKPTVLPFFNNFSSQRKLKKEVKRLKAEGATQKEIEAVLANFKEEPREKMPGQILLQDVGEPDQDELFYFQLPKTLPFKQELTELKSGTCLGKLKVFQSGKAKLVFENGLELEIRRGIETAFYQEAAILDHEKKEARMLGSVGNKFVLSPELRTLFEDNLIN